MTTQSSLIELKNILPQNSWPQVIKALRHDRHIWKAIQNPDFRELAISRLGSHPHMWNPTNLALLSLELDLEFEALRTTPLIELDPEFRLHVIQTYEAHSLESPPEMTLATAGLLALALQEHHRLTNSWERIPQTAHWLTAYACLYNLIEKPIPLLAALPVSTSIHTILANPLSPEDQINLLTSISASLTTRSRLAMLRELRDQRPDLSVTIARRLWHGNQDSANLISGSQSHLIHQLSAFEPIQTLSDSLQSELALAEAQLTAEHNQSGVTSLQLAWQSAKELQITLAGQITQAAARLGDIEKSKTDFAKMQSLTQISPADTAALVLIWLDQGYLTEAKTLFKKIEDQPGPMVLLAKARISQQLGDQKAAKEAAHQISEKASYLSTEYQIFLAKLLLELKQASDAIQVLEITRRSQPNHSGIIHLTALAYAAAGAYPRAIHDIHLAVALEPNQIDIYRDYAQFHELAGLWPAAMKAREQIIKSQNHPKPADFHFLAQCALNLNQYQQAQVACKSALEQNPEDGLAYAILGDSYLGMGDQQNALTHFEKALQLAPDQALPWLEMAHFHNQADNSSEGTETLLKAIHAAPDQAEIHLALGEDYLKAGSHSQALSYFKKANTLTNKDTSTEGYHLQRKIALPLSKTLFELGHAEKALKTIQISYPLLDNNVEILHLQAQILTFLKRADQAIPYLSKALLVNPSDPAINIDFARAYLEANRDPSKAIDALQTLIEKDPENLEALAWLAEALKAKGDPMNALSAYRKALGTQLSTDPHWHPKLSIGLAQSALEIDQPEIALAALQKNWQTTPQNHLIITKTLAASYRNAHLYDKALQTARSVRELEPISSENLIWFAELADEIQVYDEAIDALNYAIEFEPYRADLLLKLSRIYQKIDDITQALQTVQLLAEVEQATSQELSTAAELLLELNHPEDAIACLKIAIQRCLDCSDNQPCSKLISDLVAIYQQIGMHADALESVNEYINQQDQKDPSLLGERAILLNQLGCFDESQEALSQAFSENLNNNPLHLAASRIYYSAGNLQKALEHAQEAIDSIGDNEKRDSSGSTLALAADIANACLQTNTINQIFQHPSNSSNLPLDLSYLCLRSEIALESGQEIDAAKALTAALDQSPQHPRVLALQARLTTRHGDSVSAHQTLQDALAAWEQLQHQENISPAGMLGLSEAALELHEWDAAIYLLREAAKLFPQEPRTHFRLARGLVLRAEFKRLCETLRVTHHAPGSSAIANFTYQQFEQAILSAVATSDGLNLGAHQSRITYWRVRGQAIFQPSQEHAHALDEFSQTPESRAAHLAALRYSAEYHQNEQTLTSSHHLIRKSETPLSLMIEYALALNKDNPKLAAKAAQNALDTSIRQRNPSLPIFYAVQAAIAEQTGDLEFASIALENALSQWKDEPRWHLWTAEIQQALPEPDYDSILKHLTQAIELEPKYGQHHLTLGQIYLQNDNPQAAIPVLEEATRLLSRQAKPWLSLAYAYKATGDIAQIFKNAETAAELEPSNIDPHILLAESALEINNPEKAIQYSQNALKIDPSNPDALLLKAHGLDLIGKSPEALQAFEQALERAPKTIQLMLDHAQLTRRVSGNPTAIEALQHLANQYPNNAQVLAELAEVLIENNQTEPAILVAQKALRSSQGSLDKSKESHLHNSLGRLMRRNGQLDQAINYLNKAIQSNPESVASYMELGRVYQDRRQYPEAIDAFQQAISLDPGNAQVYYQAGQTLKETKDYAAAEDMLQSAAKLAPDDLAIRRKLGGLVALNLVHNRKNTTELYVE